jgi:biopolymer transport protein ExbB/TolQ
VNSLISVSFFVVLIGSILVLWFLLSMKSREAEAQRERAESLERAVARLQKNIEILKDHDAAIKALQQEKAELLKKIKGAKTDEDAKEILSSIIGRNNSRMRSH